MASNGVSKNSWIHYSEWALWFNAISAIFGGGLLLGGAAGMPMWLLDKTPFSSFTIPGVILLVAVGGSSLLGAAARNRQWSTRYPLTFLAGAVLLGWIVVEFFLIPQGWMAQIPYAAVALLMIVGSWNGWRSPSGHGRS